MSMLAVSDIVFSDLLSELHLKPWWEKIRGYFFAGTVVSALIIMYFSLSSTSINCLPLVAENATTCTSISAAQANFANNFCYNQLPWYVSFLGYSPLCLSVIILLASSYWTQIPDVIKSFRTFAEFEKMVTDLNLTSEQICDMTSATINDFSPMNNIKVRKACSLLWKYESSTNVGRHYKIRNLILFFVTIVILAIAVFMFYFLFVDNNNFECFINIDSETTEKVNVIKQQFCSHNKINNLKPYWLAFAILIFFQGVLTAVGGFMLRSEKGMTNDKKMFSYDIYKEQNLSSQGVMAAKYSSFMIIFWKNSKTTSGQNLEKIVNYTFCDAIFGMGLQLEERIGDETEMIFLYCNLKKNGGDHLIDLIMKEIKKGTFSANSKYHDNILRCIKHLKPRLGYQKLKDFTQCLFGLKLWELLANVLVADQVDWVEDGFDMFNILSDLTINTNEIGQPYDLGRSILYYFLPGGIPLNLRAAFILSHLLDQYVHNDGKCERVRHCIYDSYLVKVTNKITKMQHSILSRIQSGNLSQQRINRLCLHHDEKTREFKEKLMNSENKTDEETTMSEYVRYLENLAEIISRFKFGVWSENIDQLARFANEEEQWVLLVALFNTYISPTRACPILGYTDYIADCSINEFTLISEENQNTSPPASILYYALRIPKYLKHIQWNAILHILKYTRGQERNVRMSDGEIVSAVEYVEKSDDLTSAEKGDIIQMLENDDYPLLTQSSVGESPNDENHDVASGNISAPAPALLQMIDEESFDEVIVEESPNDENRDEDSGNIFAPAPAFLQMIDEESSDDANEPLLGIETTTV